MTRPPYVPARSVTDIRPGDHLCQIYGTEEERRSVITPFLRAGLERNEKVLYIADTQTEKVISEFLLSEGVDVGRFRQNGQFTVLTVADTYLKDGNFDPDRMIALLSEETDRACNEGYAALRVTGEMSWVLRGLPGSERLIEYENKLNTFFPGSRCLAICQYDRRLFDADFLLQVLATHPHVVIGTNLIENFFFVNPDEFLLPGQAGKILDRRLACLAARKASEDALQESEEQYRTLIDHIRDGIYILDSRGNFTYVNDVIVRRSGYPEHWFIGRSYLDVIRQEDRDLASGNFSKILKGETVAPYELAYPGAYEEMLWVEINTAPLRHQDRVVGLLGISRDISERKRVEAALRESEERYRTIVETAQEGIWVLDAEYRTVSVNDFMAQMLGYSPAEMNGRPFSDFLHREELPDHERVAAQIKNGVSEKFERLYKTREGGKVWGLVSSTPIFNDGRFSGAFAMVTDITERKVAEREVDRIAREWQQTFDTTNDAIFILDRDQRVVRANRTAERFFQCPSAEMIGRHCWEIVHSTNHPITGCPITQMIQSRHRESMELQADEKWFEITVDPLPDAAGGHNGAVHIVSDITGRKRTEMAVREANRKLHILSSITRHDILNQLMVLKAYLDFSHEALDTPDAMREYLMKEHKAVDIIESQITFTRDYQELGISVPIWLNMKEMVRKATDQLPLKSVQVDPGQADVEVLADPLFEKVCYNLIDNALRYGGPGITTIRFSATESDQGLLLVCEDDGAGISAGDRIHLFTRGFGKNTGLGLFLSREILSITGITIAETGESGKGARFEMLVPKGAYRFATAK